ncbi:hypothetical protein EPI10_010369 [Gossypium australe]|uniref:Uncharacterized protein n=1 Tax=Gossypium australe TaxID=47621 RepID=A0A5B6W578_9ROSI|nr:hypothetical protein EPI10_010369 [Gossypium australe]
MDQMRLYFTIETRKRIRVTIISAAVFVKQNILMGTFFNSVQPGFCSGTDSHDLDSNTGIKSLLTCFYNREGSDQVHCIGLQPLIRIHCRFSAKGV